MTERLPAAGLLGAYVVPDSMRAAAAATVTRYVTDQDDRDLLLEMLDLTDAGHGVLLASGLVCPASSAAVATEQAERVGGIECQIGEVTR